MFPCPKVSSWICFHFGIFFLILQFGRALIVFVVLGRMADLVPIYFLFRSSSLRRGLSVSGFWFFGATNLLIANASRVSISGVRVGVFFTKKIDKSPHNVGTKQPTYIILNSYPLFPPLYEIIRPSYVQTTSEHYMYLHMWTYQDTAERFVRPLDKSAPCLRCNVRLEGKDWVIIGFFG